MAARASARWQGGLKDGSGTFTAGDTLTGGYTYRSRFEDGPGSNPEQLIGAAHAACFSMALAGALERAGHVATSISTSASVTLRPVDGRQTIVKIKLDTTGDVPGIDEATFLEHARAAKESCPVSRALAGGPEVEVRATLAV